MKAPIVYDGTGKLGDAIAALYGCSPRSNNKISALVGEAKAALGVGKSKKLDADVNRAIWKWHYDRLHQEADADVKIYSQSANSQSVDIISQVDDNELVEIISQPELPLPVDIISQSGGNEVVEIFSQYPDTALVRIAFNIQRQGKRVRQVIALHGFYINALMLATGITKAVVPKWVQAAVDSWAAFDAELPITLQVKLLLIRELTTQLERLKQD